MSEVNAAMKGFDEMILGAMISEDQGVLMIDGKPLDEKSAEARKIAFEKFLADIQNPNITDPEAYANARTNWKLKTGQLEEDAVPDAITLPLISDPNSQAAQDLKPGDYFKTPDGRIMQKSGGG